MDKIFIIMKKIFKHAYWYIQQISGERLQDHWSSGLCNLVNSESCSCIVGLTWKNCNKVSLKCLW